MSSNGTHWWSNAASTRSRIAASRSRTVVSAVHSERSTTVFRHGPSTSANSSRLATGHPNVTSS